MKKLKFTVVFILFGIILSTCFSCMTNQNRDKKTLVWLKEKSFFVGSHITDEGTIVFDYSICFHNYTDDDFEVSLSARFKKNELVDWVEYSRFYEGKHENDIYATIHAQEETNIVFSFEGKYIGSSMPTDLSFPEEFIIAFKILT